MKEGDSLKRRELIKRLEKGGFVLKEHGGNHDIYKRGSDIEIVPRHKEINEITAKKIIKKWGL
ncbi:MAG: type II toxin-antitoxin system HicA family toxin [Clostridiales bacterium]|nr:type II toxin-antitoxin system HicA family toxin [Clostridiales bacterium]